MTTIYVLPYVDPDMDGVGSALAYADLRQSTSRTHCEAVIFGSCDSETEFVLRHFDVEPPRVVSELPPDSPLVLVDTHHPNQLPPDLQLGMVVEILDHHPAGSPAAFPNATIENEPIGAVATLVAEKMRAHGYAAPPSLAGILAAAIVSNTLNFTAPSTTQRDHDAFHCLTRIADVGPSMIAKMFDARSQPLAALPTEKLLTKDYKEFAFDGSSVGIAQIEMRDAENVTGRTDLLTALTSLKENRGVTHAVLNVVDLNTLRSTLVTPDLETERLLGDAGRIEFRNGIAHCDRICLRKTELVPWFERALRP